MISAICFDLGGTLFYTRGESFSGCFARLLGVPLSEIRPLVIKHFYTASLPLYDAVAAFCQEFTPARSAMPDVLRTLQELSPQTFLYSETLTALQALRGYRLAVLSNATFWESTSLAQFHLADMFEVAINSYEVGCAKPDPRAFSLVQQRLDLPPPEIVMVGDSAVDDVAGAKAVGWKAIHLRRNATGDERSLAADAVVHSLSEVQRVIEQW